MAYRDFTLEDIEMQFGIKNRIGQLFDQESIEKMPPSPALLNDLEEARELPIRSEKAKSELVVMPSLRELDVILGIFHHIIGIYQETV